MVEKKKIAHRRVSEPCRIGQTLELLGGRWKGSIIWWLQSDPRRFGELRRLLDGITPKVLTGQLRQLERDGLVASDPTGEIRVAGD